MYVEVVTARVRYVPSCSFTFYRITLGESTVGRDLQFIVLVRV